MALASRTRRLVVLSALPLALWAAVPAVQWCPLGWERICTRFLLGCEPTRAAAEAAEATDECPLMGTSATAAPHDACSSADCPLAHATPVAPPAHRASFPYGRAYCLGDPNGGAALQPSALQIHPSTTLVAILAATQPDQRLTAAATIIPQLAGRPPPEPWLRCPPARAPPSSRLT